MLLLTVNIYKKLSLLWFYRFTTCVLNWAQCCKAPTHKPEIYESITSISSKGCLRLWILTLVLWIRDFAGLQKKWGLENLVSLWGVQTDCSLGQKKLDIFLPFRKGPNRFLTVTKKDGPDKPQHSMLLNPSHNTLFIIHNLLERFPISNKERVDMQLSTRSAASLVSETGEFLL